MADSGALRVRRARAHKAGDHSLCKRCPAVRGGNSRAQTVTLVPPPQRAPDFDPAAEMRALAARLVCAHEADSSNTALAEQLRKTLTELMPKGRGNADVDLTGLFDALQA